MKILVVDDDAVILELIKLFLASIDFEDVHLVLSGQEALDLVAKEDTPFDCILLDINMPQMTGIELIGRLRPMPDYQDTPIIMLTALGDRRHVAQAFVAGAWDYIIKPFDPFDLETRVHAARLRLSEQRNARKLPKAAEHDFEGMFQRHSKSGRDMSAPDMSQSGIISEGRFENCLQRLAANSPNAISLAVIEVENLSAIARKLGATVANDYLVVLADHLTDVLRARNAILAYQGHGVFLAISFVGGRNDQTEMANAVLRASARTDAVFLPEMKMQARLRLGEVMYRDLPKGSDPVDMLVAAAQSMSEPLAAPRLN